MVLYLIYYFGADRKSPGPIMCSDWLKLWRSSCQKLLSRWNCNIIEMMTGWSSTNLFIFVWIGNPKWPSPGDLFYHWTLWEFHWKTFLWETTWQIEFFALYECSLDGLVPESNMAARANNVFCLAETLKIFLSERNCNIVGMMTGWSSTKFLFFVADGKSKMASIFQVSLQSDPMGIVLKDLFVTGYETNWIFCSVWIILGWFFIKLWNCMLMGNPKLLSQPNLV